MRRIVTAITAAALALSLVAQATPAAALVAGYDSAYAGESAFLTLRPGETGSFTVFFANTGQTTWTRGTSTQVDLFACLNDKVTCDVAPEEAAWNPGTWLSATRYATHVQNSVVPTAIATFTYNVVVPANAAPGDYDFNGDLGVSSLSGSGARIHPEGYFQRVTVPTPTAAGTTVTPTDAAVNSVSDGSNLNRGARTYTVTVAGSTACVDIALIPGSSESGGRFNDDNVTGGDNIVDGFAATNGVIEVVNGVATAGTDDFVDCVTPGAGGVVTFTIDSTVPGTVVKPVVFTDANNNNNLDLTGTSDASGNRAASETVGVGGQKTWVAAQAAAFGGQLSGTACRKDAAANIFSLDTGPNPGPTTAATGATAGTTTPDPSPTAGECDVSFVYDANDTFFVSGVPVTEATFEAELSRGDVVTVGPYAADAAAQSRFDITTNSPAAPGVTCTVGTSGQATNDVTISIDPTQPDTLALYTSFEIQRRPVGGAFATIATPTADATVTDPNNTFEYVDMDLAAGQYEYRARGTVDGDAGTFSGVCGPVTAAAPGTPGTAPVSNDLFISTSGGLGGQLDSGDVFKIVFSEPMNPDSLGDVIQVQDADGTTMIIRCNANPTPPAGEFGAICNFNATAETVKGTSQAANTVATVTIIGTTPATLASQQGTTVGMQLPSTVIDQGGFVDTTGDPWNVPGSPDRVIDFE